MKNGSFLDRRTFIGRTLLAAGGCAAASAGAIEPFKRGGSSRLSLSLAAYSFRDSFAANAKARANGDKAGRQIDLFQFLDYCADHGCAGAELTSYYFPAEVTHQLLLRLRRHAFLRGLGISGTAVGNTFALPDGADLEKEKAHVKRWVDYAAVMAAPHIRVFAGAPKGVSQEAAKRQCIRALEECGAYAGEHGVFLGVENHGGIVAEPADLLEIVKAVQSPWVGINLDTGNFHTDDPYADLERCAPYAVNVQVKAEIKRRGAPAEAADLGRVVKILREANYQGYVALEYESAPDPWEAVPGLLQKLGALLQGT